MLTFYLPIKNKLSKLAAADRFTIHFQSIPACQTNHMMMQQSDAVKTQKHPSIPPGNSTSWDLKLTEICFTTICKPFNRLSFLIKSLP